MTALRDVARARDALRENDLLQAARLLKRVLAAQPAHATANELMAYVEARRGDKARALQHLQAATRAPDATGASWYYLAQLHLEQGKVPLGEQALRRALEIEPALFEALHDLGCILNLQGRPAEAVELLREACRVNRQSFEAHHNLGRSLVALDRPVEALAHYDEALALQPSSPETWLNRGEALHDEGRLEEALESYAKARSLRPDFPEAESNEALALLASGNLEAGWKAYEARWRGPNALDLRHRDIPRWRGDQALRGKRILVWGEQGFGDTIQFCRFIRPLLADGAEVVFESQPALQPLLALNLHCPVVAEGDRLGDFDFQIPVMSLAGALGVTLANVPAEGSYLRAPEDRLTPWATRLSRSDDRLKVAIACSGRPTHKHEQRRSIQLADFAEIGERAHLFILQKELTGRDRVAIEEGRVKAEYLGDEIVDFRDGAAILANVDLVICIDTAIAHLAGALGRPTWLLLSKIPDWRWMLGRADTPWYPSLRLYRQEIAGDWGEVLASVRRDLERPHVGR